MAITGTPHTYWVCSTCLIYSEYGAESINDNDMTPMPLGLIPANAPITAGTTEHDDDCPNFTDGEWNGEHDEPCETREFTWTACEGCGSTPGGARHALTVWEEA